jgi:RNA polymerase sigma-70 factor (ECF subfamily)
MHVGDVELLAQWRHGDMAAGEVLFERYYDPIARFFRTRVSGDIADLVQETFVGCVEGRDRMQEGASFRAYIFSVANNVLCQHLRSKYRGDDLVDFDHVSVEDLAPGPISLITRRREQQLLLAALRRISVNDQLLLELRYWQQIRTAEIARTMGLAHGTVRSRLAHARKRLEEAMTELAGSAELLESTRASFEEWARQCRELDLLDDPPPAPAAPDEYSPGGAT